MSAAPQTSPHNRVAWALSLAGLLPFLFCVIVLYVVPDPRMRYYAALAMATYGAVILSFLGGVRWGAVLHYEQGRNAAFLASMVPPLLGWFALALPLPVLFAVHALGFALHGGWDWWAGRNGALPKWFVQLRVVMSVLVCLLLILAVTATISGTA